MTTLFEKLIALHGAFAADSIPHAFGGALALAFCVGEPRATVDIDVNVFLPVRTSSRLLEALPDGVVWSDDDRQILERDGQARLWWESTPIDVFLSSSSFHEGVAHRVRTEAVGGTMLPFLSCRDLAVFKAFFNRRRDWADLEAMLVADAFDLDTVVGTLTRYLGQSDERTTQLLEVAASLPGDDPERRVES